MNMDPQQEALYKRLGERDKSDWQNISEPKGVIPPEVGPNTNPTAQLISFLQSLFAPKAHDSIDRILGENEWTVAQQQQSPEQQVAFQDSIMAQKEAGFGPSFGNSSANSLIEALLTSQGEFGAAQPVSPRIMPK